MFRHRYWTNNRFWNSGGAREERVDLAADDELSDWPPGVFGRVDLLGVVFAAAVSRACDWERGSGVSPTR